MPQRPAHLLYDHDRKAVRLDPHDPDFVQDPYPAYAYLHAHAPAFFWDDFGFWCLTDYESVNRALRDRRLGREQPADQKPDPATRTHLKHFDAIEANSMLEIEPPVHTRLRKLVNRAFVSRQVERLRPRVETLCHTLIDGFEQTGEAELLDAYATPIPLVIITEMLGVPTDMGPQLVEWSHRMVAMYMHGSDEQTQRRADEAARDFAAFIRDYARKRSATPGDDLLSLLIAAQEDGERLSEDELVSSAILLLNAGHEATVHQLGNAVSTLLAQGGDPRRFFGSDAEAAATVEECLRYDPPLHMFTRYAYETVEVAPGLTLKPGETVGLLLGAANNDLTAFEEPRSFRPGRPDQKNVSFGAGIHFCIGAPLARLEMQVGLKVLFERLPSLALKVPPVYGDTYHFHGLERLDCVWDAS
ncbi:cytochrome P450 [Nitratireductor aquimarinus]|uniref:cytochrome P450 n=1 Tax=Nitratireductor aquimarinus TaxID=889300 RepID=UPI001A8C5112|nr:cytochrome P450 [Nitratireductor aquimarinus]MBN8241661.1 cytochrome P450 [Nitratireductor aquimarinus]MBY6130047.1 cytochrome P450 [Nitratireductor aquimarinus]MCA1304176.1 cytochrome P450 [Nitratireductor aquimarinus]